MKRDRLWFMWNGRQQGKEQTPGGGDYFPNLKEGVFAENYVPDRAAGNAHLQEHLAQHERPA